MTSAFSVVLGVAGVWGVAGCTAQVGDMEGNAGSGSASGSGTGSSPGNAGTGGGSTSTGTGSGSGSTGGGTGSGNGAASGGGTGVASGSGGTAQVACSADKVSPGRAPMRRLTKFEFNNTVRDLFGDASSPGDALPSETLADATAIFGNNADSQSVSNLLVEQYEKVAQGIAQRATANATALGKLNSCASSITATSTTATEEACAKSIVTSFLPKAYRRAVTTAETDELVTLFKTIRTGGTFATAISGVLEGVLQSADFLYRPEFGVADAAKPSLKRPSGYEMAARLSYLFWGSTPDDKLTTAAASGSLVTTSGVMDQAKRLLDDAKSHTTVAYFFDSLLPINNLTGLERDPDIYKTFNANIGNLMHQETQRFLEYEIYEGPGSWTNILTAPYTFVNETLAKYYGMTGVTGAAFQKVNLDTTKRIGLLSQGGVMAGSTISQFTSPVLRGSFVVQKMMCRIIPLPTGDILAMVKPPDPYAAKTARERYGAHSKDPVCATCHQFMDPVGLTLENYDPVGLWRDTENDVKIDASGSVPGTDGTVNGPVEMIQKFASAEATKTCFASHWLEYAYGRTIEPSGADACSNQTVQNTFKSSGYNVKQMLLALTQTDAFLYLPAQ